MSAQLEFFADCYVIETLAKDGKISFAQDEGGGVISSVTQGVKEYVSKQFDKDRPVASVVNFLGKGLLWSLGFKWMAILYTVTEALGFDWQGFWHSVGTHISDFVRSIVSSKKAASEEDASAKINSAVSESINTNFSGETDYPKLIGVAKSALTASFNDVFSIKKVAYQIQKENDMVKLAAPLGILKLKMAKFFTGTIAWLIKTALISLGLVSAAGAVSGLLGVKHKENSSDEHGGDEIKEHTEKPKSNSHDKDYTKLLTLSPNTPRDLFAVHHNDTGSLWIEKGDIGDIEDILMSWVLYAFPQLSKMSSKIQSHSSFQSMVSKFKSRNDMAMGLNIFATPKPYQRKIDIVFNIVNPFIKENLGAK